MWKKKRSCVVSGETLENGIEAAVSLKISDRVFACIIAVAATFLAFSVFIGQEFNVGFISFQYGSDAFRQIYPAFCQAWKLVLKNGVDIGSFNGATEMVFRPNLSMQYPFFILFSMLGKLTRFKAAYILYYVSHMAVFVYYGIRLAMERFGLNRKYACLFALSSLSVLFTGSWYTPFYTITALVTPMLYYAIKALGQTSWKKYFLYSFPYVCGFLSGYVTVSVFECGIILLITILYGLFWTGETPTTHTMKRIIGRSFAPFCIATAVTGLYLLQIYQYVKGIVAVSSLSISDAFIYPMRPKDWFKVLSDAFSSVADIEHSRLLHLGWAWAALLLFFAGSKGSDLFKKKQRGFLYSIFGLSVALLLITAASDSPFAYWFYTVPVFGAMHLPIRYFLVITPCFFLAATIYVSGQAERRNTWYWKLLIVLTLAVCGCLLFKRSYFEGVNENRLLVELLVFLIFLIIYRKHGMTAMAVGILALSATMPPILGGFYNSAAMSEAEYKSFSIVYSDEATGALQNFLDSLPDQNRYRFLTLDDKAENQGPDYLGAEAQLQIPIYVPNNYA